MGADTKIEWATHSASPWHGCSKVAPGCDNCYAARQAVRNPGTLGIWGDGGTRIKSKSFIANLRLWNAQAAKEGKPVSVFPSICDPFEDRPELVPWRQEMFATIDECPWVRLLLLTKRPENINKMWPVCGHCRGKSVRPTPGRCPRCNGHGQSPRRTNVWLGTSVAVQADADKNIPALLECRDLSPVLFLSCEPLLGPIDLEKSTDYQIAQAFNAGFGASHARRLIDGLDWLIVGGESGPNARPCSVDWIRSIRDQCSAAGVPCFVKQLGANIEIANDGFSEWPNDGDGLRYNSLDHGPIHQGDPLIVRTMDKKGGDSSEWPEDLRVRQFPQTEAVA